MRTTVELPPDLMKQAKAKAAARGETLKTLLTRAVAAELGKGQHLHGNASRAELPLFGNPKAKSVAISNTEIARALAQDDLNTVRRPERKK
jgi:hypothetical protein